jgi:hypothetical protein
VDANGRAIGKERTWTLVPLVVALGTFNWPAAASAQVATTRVSLDSAGVEGDSQSFDPVLSGDGQVVAFWSYARNLVPGDTNISSDVFVRDLTTGITERVSVTTAGAEGNMGSCWPAISADGSVVAFVGFANNLVPGDTNGYSDVFVHDRVTGVTTRVSVSSAGVEGNKMSDGRVALSSDGQFVVFSSIANNLVAGDTNGSWDIFVHDRSTSTTTRVSVSSAGLEGNYWSNLPAISADGEVVAFTSWATNLIAGDTNGVSDVFMHDRSTGITTRVSVSSAGIEGDLSSEYPALSADGQSVAFRSFATNLISGDTNGAGDIFVFDRSTGVTTRVSVDSTGGEHDGYVDKQSSLSDDGEIVVFSSDATNLVAGDTNWKSDVFMHDRTTGVTERVSVDSAGGQSDGYSSIVMGALSSDGQVVAFHSDADNFAPGDTNYFYDVFVHGYSSALATWKNYGSGLAGTLGVPSFTSRDDPIIGTTIRLDIGNSRGAQTAGLLFGGASSGSLKYKGGTLLVDDIFLLLQLPIAAAGISLDVDVPNDLTLVGVPVYLQVLEVDPGAPRGFSFTPGLELDLGF